MKHTTAALIATAACLMIAAPAFAADRAPAHEAESPAKAVRYSELNLQNAAGVQALYTRLHAAARQVCAAQDGRSLRERTAYGRCVSTSLERAVREVRNDAVLALHNERQNAARRG